MFLVLEKQNQNRTHSFCYFFWKFIWEATLERWDTAAGDLKKLPPRNICCRERLNHHFFLFFRRLKKANLFFLLWHLESAGTGSKPLWNMFVPQSLQTWPGKKKHTWKIRMFGLFPQLSSSHFSTNPFTSDFSLFHFLKIIFFFLRLVFWEFDFLHNFVRTAGCLIDWFLFPPLVKHVEWWEKLRWRH